MTSPRVLLVVGVVLVGGCKFAELPPVTNDAAAIDATSSDSITDAGTEPDAADAATDGTSVPTYSVGGTVQGMWTGATVALEITAPPAATERIVVAADGTFSFPTGLVAGRTFSVAVPSNGQPFLHQCVVQNPNGMIVDANVTDRQVVCTTQAAVDVEITAPIDVNFDPNVAVYSYETADGVQETRVKVTAPAATSILLNNSAITSGFLNGPVPVEAFTVRVVINSISRTFTFNVKRNGPSYQSPLYAKSSNSGAGDRQGIVSASGNLLAVGSPLEDSSATGVNQNQNSEASQDSGAVYIYRRDGLGWVQEAYLKGSVNVAGDHFGASVSLVNQGTTALLAVGVPLDDSNSADSGAVYVFRRSSGGVWTEEQRLKASSPSSASEFGSSVSLNRLGTGGLALAVGARAQGGTAAGSGAAYVFRYSGTVWAQEAFLKAPNIDANDHFGERVGLAGNVLVVAAPDEDSIGVGINSGLGANNTAPDSGAVFVYRRDGVGMWNVEAYIKGSNAAAGDRFGAGLSLDATTLAVGAPREDSDGTSQTNNNTTNSGAVYMFEYASFAWTQSAYLKLATPLTGAYFGADVCVYSNMVIGGAPETEASSQASNGLVQYFARPAGGGTWTPGATIVAVNADEQQDEFGTSVSLSGEGIFVGAPLEDSNARGFGSGLADNSAVNSGAVYGYY